MPFYDTRRSRQWHPSGLYRLRDSPCVAQAQLRLNQSSSSAPPVGIASAAPVARNWRDGRCLWA